jgi:hypothetical protein
MIEELEKSYEQTTRLLLGTGLQGLDNYGPWLGRRVPVPKKAESALSGKEVWTSPPYIYMKKAFNPKKAVSLDEIGLIKEPEYGENEVRKASVMEMCKLVQPLAFYCGNFRHFTYSNIERCSGAGAGCNIYMCDDVFLDVKNVAFSNYALYCNNSFGCHGVMHSNFLIHAYNSERISRCFDVESCFNSSDLLFCHNCENVHDSMFCFNVKNMRNAVGNVQLRPDQYKKVKKMVQMEIVDELQKNRWYGRDIFNIGGN